MLLNHFNILVQRVRLPNLIIIALVLYLQRWCLVIPGIHQPGIEPGWAGYGLIVLGTVLIAAGGYLINDHFDVEIDAVNRPEKAAALRLLPPAALRKTYYALTLAGLLSAGFACYVSGIFALWLVYLSTAALLFWYASRLKKRLFYGNLVVAMASALVMLYAWLYDMFLMQSLYPVESSDVNDYRGITTNIIIYSLFAFLISFVREIIKDIEDMEGDSRFGCRSLPVVFGVPAAKKVIIIGLTMIFILLFLWQAGLYNSGHMNLAIYLVFAVDLPLAWLSAYVMRMKTRAQSHLAGQLTRMIMVTGILSMLWFIV